MICLKTFGVLASATAALVTLSSAGAEAEPASDDSCTFTLTSPVRAQLGSGAEMVTATVSPQRCGGKAQPIRTTVCVSTGDGAPQCRDATGWNTAAAYLGPWVAGTSFTATGSGCYTHGPVAESVCTPVGPATTRL